MISPFIKKYILPIFLFLVFFVLYLHNLSLSVYGGDVGDLVTAAKVMGVPHPPGYPLFTLLGFILTRINFLTPAFMVGLISVFSSSFTLVIFYLFSLKLSNSKFIALISSLIFGLNYLFWFYAEIAEAFALNNLFVILLLFLAYLYSKNKEKKYLYILSLFVGMSLTNHHTILLIFPSVLVLILSNYKNLLKNPRQIIISIFLMFIGLLFYLYVFIASAHNPPINWDNVKDLDSFLRLFFRKDYGTFSAGIFSGPNSLQRVIILNTYFFEIITQLTIPVVTLSIIGILSAFKNNRKLAISLLLGFMLSGPFFIAYSGFAITTAFILGVYERFFSMSTVIILLFFPLGLKYIVELLDKIFKKKTYKNLFIGVFIIIPILLFNYNFTKTDLHNVWNGDYLAYDLLSFVPNNSVIIIGGDTPLFNSLYLKYAVGFRKDLEIMNAYGLDSSKYFNNMYSQYNKKYPNNIRDKNKYINIIKYIATKRPVFSNSQLQASSGKKIIWVPFGLVNKLETNENKIPLQKDLQDKNASIWRSFKFDYYGKNVNIANNSLTIADMQLVYSNASINLGKFILSQYKDYDTAYKYFRNGQIIDPQNFKAYQSMAVYLTVTKKCDQAEANIQKAIEINYLDKNSYYLQYINNNECFNSPSKRKIVVNKYNSIFSSDFFKDLNNFLKNN